MSLYIIHLPLNNHLTTNLRFRGYSLHTGLTEPNLPERVSQYYDTFYILNVILSLPGSNMIPSERGKSNVLKQIRLSKIDVERI